MKRGRKPRPPQEKRLLGFPGKRKGESITDALPGKVDTTVTIMKPARLKKIKGASGVWDELIDQLPVRLEPVQVRMFSELCICLARLERIEAQIEREGILVGGTRKKKAWVKNPRLQIEREYRVAVEGMAGNFYLTPAAVASVPREKPEPRPSGILNGQFLG